MQNPSPLITIITVVYNGVNSIEQTIQSVINLSYPNIAYIIIDGNSTDDTVKIIKRYEAKITKLVIEADQGIYDAMNKGWALAKDDSYILYLGSGDKIIKLPNMELHQDAGVIYGDVALGEKGVFRSTVGWRSFLGNSIHHQALLIKKSLHILPPFSLKFKIYADFDFNQRLIKAGVKFHRDTDFYAYALDGGVSAKMTEKESLMVVKKNYGLWMYFFAIIYYQLQSINGFRKNISRNRSL